MYPRTFNQFIMTKTALILSFLALISADKSDLTVNSNDIEILIGNSENVILTLSNIKPNTTATINAFTNHPDIVKIIPERYILNTSDISTKWNVTLSGINPGYDTVIFNTSFNDIKTDEAFIRVTVERSRSATIVSIVVGWLYFVAWSVSFYPQIYENWKRKSVVGLNFDFLALNLIGFFLYSVFNCGLYWNAEIEAEYFERHPRGLNPVQKNDIFFSLHATIITIITILQCFCYERAQQRVSNVARGLIVIFTVVVITTLLLAVFHVVHWLDFITYCSYVKLTITLIKYVPQAYMNYKRKSTIGWSIGNVMLDFTGGILSMLQMIINAENYDDWISIFGDPTKFGLGLFSVMFDIFFIIQHYVLYRSSSYQDIEETRSNIQFNNEAAQCITDEMSHDNIIENEDEISPYP